MQQLRLRFCWGAELKYISLLDIIRLWHRVLKRTGIELAYSEGFNPTHVFTWLPPLPLGVTAEAKLMDIVINTNMPCYTLPERINQQLPQDIKVLQSMPVPL